MACRFVVIESGKWSGRVDIDVVLISRNIVLHIGDKAKRDIELFSD